MVILVDLVVYLIMTLFKMIAAVVFGYLFWWRVVDYTLSVRFYGSQPDSVVKVAPGHLPFIGNLFQILWSMRKSYAEGDNYFIMKH